MGRWYLAQLAGGASLEDVALIDLQVSQGDNRAAELVVFQHPEAGLYQQMAESLDTLRASPEMEIFHEVEQDESVIERVTAAQREELESAITGLKTEAEQAAEEARELAGEVPF